jgi:excisionase family DNA binding protein
MGPDIAARSWCRRWALTSAKRLDVHPNTVRGFIADKKLKGYNVGRLIRLDAAEVEDFIKEIATGA